MILANGDKVLLNTQGAPAAYSSVVSAPEITLLASTTLGGTYLPVNSAVVDSAAKTINVAIPAVGSIYYRVSSSAGPVTLQQITVAGADLVIRYE